MRAQAVGLLSRSVPCSRRSFLPTLLAILAAAIFLGSSVAGAATAPPSSKGAAGGTFASDNPYSPPGDWKTHEDYNLPQDQWGRAYREGLRQGYDAGRIFPDQLDQAYRQGLQEGYRARQDDDEINIRTQKLLRTRDEALQTGRQALAEGRYDEATDAFLLATQLDHGDPASRLYAAQALFALQQYEQALPLLRRAFELQPNLLYLKFDLRLDYGDPTDLATQLIHLQTFMTNNPDWSGGYLLLGYERLHSGQRAAAYQAFQRAAQLDPVDTLSRKFLRVSFPLPAKAAPRTAPSAKAPPPTSPKPAARISTTAGNKA